MNEKEETYSLRDDANIWDYELVESTLLIALARVEYVPRTSNACLLLLCYRDTCMHHT